jgi:hypothetical protein
LGGVLKARLIPSSIRRLISSHDSSSASSLAMAISPENRERLLNATKETAAAFIEDLGHIRELIKSDPARGDVRRLSGILRRFLVDNDGDIRRIAPPRLDRRIQFSAPDNNDFYAADRKVPFQFFASGAGISFQLFGAALRGLCVRPGIQPPFPFDSERVVSLASPIHGG